MKNRVSNSVALSLATFGLLTVLACPSAVPAPESLLFSCENDQNCRSDEHCDHLRCVKNVDAGGLSGEAGFSDALVISGDGSLADRVHSDSGFEDTLIDAGLDAAMQDHLSADTASTDILLSDAILPDQLSADVGAINHPPTLVVSETELWTYLSTAHHAWTVTTGYVAADEDGDSVQAVFTPDSNSGCSLDAGSLIYNAPVGFVGDTTCRFYAEEIEQANPLQSTEQTVTIHVLAARASCYRIQQDADLRARDIGQSSGLYMIDPDGDSGGPAFEAYCDQDNEGGGWTLALTARNSDPNYDLSYLSAFWASGSEGLVHLPQQPAPDPNLGCTAKFLPYHRLPFRELMIGMISEAEMAVSPQNMHYLPRDISGGSLLGVFSEQQPDWTPWKKWDGEAWNNLLPGAALQQYCRFEGFHVGNYPRYSTRARLGIMGNETNDCGYTDSALGIGLYGESEQDPHVGYFNNYYHDSVSVHVIPAYALVYLRDSHLQDLQTRRSCMAHRLNGAEEDGLYVIDPNAADWPPAFTAFCDMHNQGGGWTLLTANGTTRIWEDWSDDTFFADWSLSSPQWDDDFRSRAMMRLGINDLRFAAASNSNSSTDQWMLYRDALPLSSSMPSRSYHDVVNEFQNPVCSMDASNSFHLTAGQMSAPNMCDHSLYLSPIDQDGSLACDVDEDAIGPAWSHSRNDGCPHDDPAYASFREHLDDDKHPFYDMAIQTWGRETDFHALPYAASCQAHYDAGHRISGSYTIQHSPMGSARTAYCLMDRDNNLGWERVAHFDVGYMNDCPGDLQFRNDPRACWRNMDEAGFRSAVFPVQTSYQHVRGFVRALQKGSPDAFSCVSSGDPGSVAGLYVDGISLTYQDTNAAHHHLWTYALGMSHSDNNQLYQEYNCPCNGGATAAPSYIADDWSCDSALDEWSGDSGWNVANPLFDGIDSACGETEDPKWFQRDLDAETSDDIVLRLMADEDSDNEDIGLTAVELYVR